MQKRNAIIVGIIAVALLAGGGAYAYFSDTESTNNNQFHAGTMDLVVNDQNPWADAPISLSGLKPGSNGGVSIKLANTGNVGGTLTMALSNVLNSPGGTPEPEVASGPDNGELGAALDMTIWLDTNGDGVHDAGETTVYYTGHCANTGSIPLPALGPSDVVHIGIGYSIPTSVGNEIMDDSVTFTITFELTSTYP